MAQIRKGFFSQHVAGGRIFSRSDEGPFKGVVFFSSCEKEEKEIDIPR